MQPYCTMRNLAGLLIVLVLYCNDIVIGDGGTIEPLPVIVSPKSLVQKFETNFLELGKPSIDKKIPKIELVIALDFSESVTAITFLSARNFIERLLCYFSISPSTTRVALVRTTDQPVTELTFTSCRNREHLLQRIRAITNEKSGSSIDDVLLQIQKTYADKEQRVKKIDTKRIVLILSDGASTASEKALRKYNVKVQATTFVVELPNPASKNPLASQPRDKNTFSLNQLSDLGALAKDSVKLDKYSECDQLGEIVHDECNRRCICVDGTLTSCTRVRMEFLSMSNEKRAQYLQTYKDATTKEPWKTKYETMTLAHKELFQQGIHELANFLPWHRWYILELENLLREIDCTVTVPYWDWSVCTDKPWSKDHLWNAGPHGLGRKLNSRTEVIDGLFGITSGWKTPDGKQLRRAFRDKSIVPNAKAVEAGMKISDFATFEVNMRGRLHDSVHYAIGGTMVTLGAAYAPEFFLHHGFVDKMWNDWQMRSTENQHVFFHCLDSKLMGAPYKGHEFLDLCQQPGNVRVQYDEVDDEDALKAKQWLKVLSEEDLLKVPSVKALKVSQETLDLFKVSLKEQRKIREIEKAQEGNVVSDTSKLNLKGKEKKLGFALPKQDVEGDAPEEIDLSIGIPSRDTQTKSKQDDNDTETDMDTEDSPGPVNTDETSQENDTEEQPKKPKGTNPNGKKVPNELENDLPQ